MTSPNEYREWLVVDAHKHRVKRHSSRVWGGYCPRRGVDDLIYSDSRSMYLLFDTPCPHLNEALWPIEVSANDDLT